jgi:excisionase family DNA binding protein
MKDRDLYSIDEARERLGGISRNSIYQLLHKGQLASVIIGTRRLVSAAAIDQLIANATTTTSPTVAAARVPLRSKRKLDLAASPLLIHNRRSDERR